MANSLPGVGGSGNLNIYSDSTSLQSSRGAIKIELDEKIVYDHPSVFQRLRLDDVPNAFVGACMDNFFTKNGKDIERLKDLEELASPNDDAKSRKLEREMYAPLVDFSLCPQFLSSAFPSNVEENI